VSGEIFLLDIVPWISKAEGGVFEWVDDFRLEDKQAFITVIIT